MSKNTCAGMSQGELVEALGIPKSTYYRYIDDEDYPMGADFRIQKAFVDELQKKSGAKVSGKVKHPKSKSKDKEPAVPVEDTKEFWELRSAKAKALKAEADLQETVDAVLRDGELYLTRRVGRLIDGIQDVIENQLCPECAKRLAEAFDQVSAGLDAHEQELLGVAK